MFSLRERWLIQWLGCAMLFKSIQQSPSPDSYLRQDMFHTSIISTGELWLSVLHQVECTSAQIICVGKKHSRDGENSCGRLWTHKTVSPPFFHWKCLKIWSNDRQTVWLFVWLVFLARCPGGGGKPEASVVKETPTRKINWNHHIRICGILLDREVLFFFPKTLLTVLSQVQLDIFLLFIIYIHNSTRVDGKCQRGVKNHCISKP